MRDIVNPMIFCAIQIANHEHQELNVMIGGLVRGFGQSRKGKSDVLPGIIG